MGYRGLTYQIPCQRGGFTYNQNHDAIEPFMMVSTTKNINLHRGGWEKRGGTIKINTTAVDSGARIMGLHDYRKPGGNEYVIIGTTNGKIYKDISTAIKTGLTTGKFFSMVTFDKKVFIANGADVPCYWDGVASTATDLTNIPTDWTGTNYPTYLIRHGRGESERLWAFKCPSTPYTIYASKNGDGTDFSDANVVTINIDTGDSFGIVGAAELADQLILFGKTQSYIVDDADADVANWGYVTAPWVGGAVTHRLIVRTPNDIICMSEDLDIYSVKAAQQYGDYRQASIARPQFINEWLKDNLHYSYIEHCHAIYDPVLRAVKFFIVRDGETEVDTCLVYFIDRGPNEGWMIHDNLNHNSGYKASCSALVRVGYGQYEIQTGDYSGFLWKLEQDSTSDDGNAIDCQITLSQLSFDDLRTTKAYKRGWVVLEPQSSETLSLQLDIGGKTVNTSITASSGQYDYPYEIGTHGRRINLNISNNTSNEDFFLRQLLFDFRTTGRMVS